MNTALIQRNLWKKLGSKKYRHSFVASQIGASISAQIASTRVARGWTQKELAKHAKMSQVRISVLEDPSYENFSIKTLRRLAEAFDTALVIRFAPFSEMLGWLTNVNPEHLAVTKFDEDLLVAASSAPSKYEPQDIPIQLYADGYTDNLAKGVGIGTLQGANVGGPDIDIPSRPKPPSAESQMLTEPKYQWSMTSTSIQQLAGVR